jgi:hypothetical protein
MFAAAMTGGSFAAPRLTASPSTYTQSGDATVRFSPPVGVTTIYVDANAGGGANVPSGNGGGQGAWADNLTISCASDDIFSLTFVAESGRGYRVKLVQNTTTLLEVRGGVDGGDGGSALTPSLTGGTAGTVSVDPGSGTSTSYLSGTVYSGGGGWDASLASPGAAAQIATYWPGAGVTYVFRSGMGAKADQTNGYEVGYGGTRTETSPTPGTVVDRAPDIARCVITW